ncbi:MAG: hypothetical protein PHF21_03430 [Bacilli bacterium]|nr:hypothetical protein [Bacilli bacterium]
MNLIIEGYIKNLTKDDIYNFAIKNNIDLTLEELNFTYNFIKTNYQEVLKSPNNFNFDKYRNNFSKNNFLKIEQLIKKYSNYL